MAHLKITDDAQRHLEEHHALEALVDLAEGPEGPPGEGIGDHQVAGIRDHDDVSGNAPTDGQLFRFSESLGMWVPATVNAGDVGADPSGSAAAVQDNLAAHEADTDNPHEVTAAQVGAVAKSGDTMTGALVLPGDPTADLEAATKQYVDSAGGGGGGLLAYTNYRPGSDNTFNTGSTSFVDIDATNLAVTFTVPSSGAVLVGLTGNMFQSTQDIDAFWGLREGSSPVAGSAHRLLRGSSVSLPFINSPSYRVVITGLTPDAELTWKWAHRMDSGSGSLNFYVGPNRSALMEVWAVP